MENREFTSVYENARLCEIPNLKEAEDEQVYDQINEDLVLPSTRQDVLDNMYLGFQESPENSYTNSLSSQHEYDGGEETDASHHDVPEDHQQKEMPLLNPRQCDESMEWIGFENKVLRLTGFDLKKTQSTSQTFPITIKLPCNKTLEENNNFLKDDYEIFLIVKVRTVTREMIQLCKSE